MGGVWYLDVSLLALVTALAGLNVRSALPTHEDRFSLNTETRETMVGVCASNVVSGWRR